MIGFFTIWRESLDELKDVRVLSGCGILAALAVALKYVASIDIGEFIRIGFSDLPGTAVSVLFGPAVGGIFWGTLDIVKYLAAPTGPFFPGFTLSAVINGILFGLIVYRRPITLPRMLAAQALSKLIVSIGLNTFWLSLLYGSPMMVVLPARVFTNLCMLFIDAGLSFVVLRFVERLWRRTMSMGDVI